MPRRRRHLRRHKGKHKISLLTLAGLGVGVSQPISYALTNDKPYGGNKALEFLRQLGISATGYDVETGQFYFGNMPKFYVPPIAGYIASRIFDFLGINRRIFKKMPIKL